MKPARVLNLLDQVILDGLEASRMAENPDRDTRAIDKLSYVSVDPLEAVVVMMAAARQTQEGE